MKKVIPFFISQAVTLFGSQIVAFALVWYITLQTGSGLWVALLSICSFVPVVGAFIACFIGIFLIATISPFKALMFVIMFLVLQQIEGQLIYPHVVGKSVGLPSLLVFCAVILGGRLFGALGILMCIPTCSLFYCLFKNLVNNRIAVKKELTQ